MSERPEYYRAMHTMDCGLHPTHPGACTPAPAQEPEGERCAAIDPETGYRCGDFNGTRA